MSSNTCPECGPHRECDCARSPSAFKSEPLVENEDFYYNDQGLFVFTEKYHLKKGSCCQNACKHCPYGFQKKQP